MGMSQHLMRATPLLVALRMRCVVGAYAEPGHPPCPCGYRRGGRSTGYRRFDPAHCRSHHAIEGWPLEVQRVERVPQEGWSRP
jgi:hypothetical protein